ncbi:dienelactone hydrolase family protein [Caulobacter mirabilis]|uniref:Dienelactone hydrolase n=1 Tax=Caulobacter mirabilis TaxID=69666 RepID=A0A2D2B1Q6_9CAUL|nr:dienelactone hydrolase family protein [Caulobacter mirabilis]ATQ44192.1 dienelactone hydrolase [Caulobacter mirabilis]
MIRATALALALAFTAGAASAQEGDDDATPAAVAPAGAPERVEFPAVDVERTPLSGFLYRPARPAAKAPAVVLMHGRAGLFSSLAKGRYEASTISQRHRWWARYWADRGYYVLLVDSFSARGYPAGFAAGTYKDRPLSVDEVNNRPMDAYGALKYLRGLPGVDGDRIGLMGWSNGASAALATMADDKPGDMKTLGFRGALAFYPGCGLKKKFEKAGYRPYAPVRVFIGTADEEVSPESCEKLVARSRKLGGDIELEVYKDATHGFDDPGKKRQGVAANATATEDVRGKAAAFFERTLAPR